MQESHPVAAPTEYENKFILRGKRLFCTTNYYFRRLTIIPRRRELQGELKGLIPPIRTFNGNDKAQGIAMVTNATIIYIAIILTSLSAYSCPFTHVIPNDAVKLIQESISKAGINADRLYTLLIPLLSWP